METMRAVVVERLGGPEVLRVADVPRPEIGLGEVLVRVRTAGINPADWKTYEGGGNARTLGDPPWIPGWDVSGVVEGLGRGVTRFAEGDEVCGMPRFPHAGSTYAEYVTAPSRQLAAKPEALSHEQAAGLPLAGLTAWQALFDTARVQRGERVLIHAAGGSVGHLAVQLAHRAGAHVIATASSGKHDELRALGARELIDHRQVAFEEVTGDVDVALVLVAGDCATRSLRVLRPGGRLVVMAGPLPDTEVLDRYDVWTRWMLVEPDRYMLERLAELARNGELTVRVHATYPLEEVRRAHEEAREGHSFGKNVLVVS